MITNIQNRQEIHHHYLHLTHSIIDISIIIITTTIIIAIKN